MELKKVSKKNLSEEKHILKNKNVLQKYNFLISQKLVFKLKISVSNTLC